MARLTQGKAAPSALRSCRGPALLAACLMLGACAQSAKPSLPTMLSQSDAAAQPTGSLPAAKPDRSELMRAVEFWGQKYAKDPRDLEAALSYAKDLKAMGEKKRALAVLQQASVFHGDSRELVSEYGRLALEFDQISLAGRLLAAADDPANPDWRVISARGTVLAKEGNYKDAIPFYEHALTLAPDHPSVLSNLALAHAMNGEPKRAEALLRQAATTDRNSLKIRQNLALVLGLEGKYDEAKLLASRDMSAESAAENTEYLRRVVKLETQRPPSSKSAPSKAAASIAKAKPPAKAPEQAEDDAEFAPAPGPAQTSEHDTKEPATKMTKVGKLLRGTETPDMQSAEASQAPKAPNEAPGFEEAFSVAQWSPKTNPTPGEVGANGAAAAKTAWQATQDK